MRSCKSVKSPIGLGGLRMEKEYMQGKVEQHTAQHVDTIVGHVS